MKTKECKYCEQTIPFLKYENHVYMCGSKTKKCFECNRNVCHKDFDSHSKYGECQAFIEEDKKKEQENIKRKMEEEKKA